MYRVWLIFVSVNILSVACADRMEKSTQTETNTAIPAIVSFSELKWTSLSEMPGMEIATLSGDPKTGAYTQMRRVRAGTDNGPHTHSNQITDVVISGVWYIGADDASAKDLGPGSVGTVPPNWVHVSGCRPGSDCIFFQVGKGKFDFDRSAPQ
jgi:quercetin dioxygenase-like cupin family protein